MEKMGLVNSRGKQQFTINFLFTVSLNALSIGIFDSASHTSGGIVQLRIQTTNIAASTHKWQFDWVAISKGIATPSSIETDPFSIHKDGTTPLTGDWNAGAFNITALNFLGNINASYVLLSPWLNLTDQRFNETSAMLANLSLKFNITGGNITGNINMTRKNITDVSNIYLNVTRWYSGACEYDNGTAILFRSPCDI